MYTETERINALQMGMEIYRACASDAATMPAAFGVAASLVSAVLGCSIKVACSLMDEELKKQGH